MSKARTAKARTAKAPWIRPAGRGTPEFLFLAAATAVLLALGLVMTFSASFVQSAADTGDAFTIFQRQLTWCVIGLPLMAGAALSDYRIWQRLALPLLLVGLISAALVLVPGIGVEVNGARRWLDVGPVRFQPSELLKLAVPAFLAARVAARWRQVRTGDIRSLLLPAVPLLLVAAGLVLAEPDLETAALLILIGGIVLYVAGLPTRFLAAAGGLTALAGAAAIITTPFRRARLTAWLQPMEHAETFGYQTVQGFIALGSGGWFGVGLGQGRGKWLYVPNAHTDFIFAIIGEELGLLGAMSVLVVYASIAIAGVRAARNAPDPFGRLLGAGIVGWLLLQAGMNMASVVGLLPVTGVTLPLLSFGGSSLVVVMLGLGILMAVARAGRVRS